MKIFGSSAYSSRNSVQAFSYRPDIDGLRAVAILAVLFYHADLAGFPGGFIGVDIFFVISGFLIASLIQKDVLLGQFSLVDFWMRRAKRIFPALAVVLFATTIASAVILISEDLKNYGKSLIAAAFFVANMHFSANLGYFDAPSLEKPLLHTWSLSIEEQFYILFPVMFAFILRRFALGKTVATMAAIVVGGACLAEVLVRFYPEQAFYMLPARIWELGLGVLVAVAAPALAIRQRTALALSLLGAALLAYAITQTDLQRSFPGMGALAPCAGAALLILSGTRSGPIQRLLSLRPIVFVGLISYSLYLWHWPILALPRYALGRPLDGWETAAALAASAMIATLTWQFIERPARAARIGLNVPLKAIGIAAIPLLMLAATGTAIRVGEGFPERMPDALNVAYSQARTYPPLQADCRGPARPGTNEHCNFGAKPVGASFDMVVWGDSHAEAVSPAFWDLAKQWGWSGRQFSGPGCMPLSETAIWKSRVSQECLKLNREFEKFVQNNKDLKLVVLGARWSVIGTAALEHHPLPGSHIELLDAADMSARPFDSQKVFRTALARTVKRLTDAGIRVVVVGQAPEYFGSALLCFMKQKFWNAHFNRCEQSKAKLLSYMAPYNRVIETVTHNNPLAKAVYLTDAICDDKSCKVEVNGVPLYRDKDHLTHLAAQQFKDFFAKQLSGFIDPAADPSGALRLSGGEPTPKN